MWVREKRHKSVEFAQKKKNKEARTTTTKRKSNKKQKRKKKGGGGTVRQPEKGKKTDRTEGVMT